MTRYFSLIDAQVASFMKVLDHSIEMLRLGARLGEIEVLDIRQEMSDAEINDHIEKGRQHGLHEVCETEFEDQQIRARTELERMIVEPQVPNARIVPWSDLEASYGTYFRNIPAKLLAENLQLFCVYDQPCHLHSDLKLTFNSEAPTVQTSQRNLIFNDGLTIDGVFDAGDCISELPLLVIVKGDLHVQNLILSGWAEVFVTGNVVVADTLFGYDGEAGGRLQVQGNLTAPRMLGGMMYAIEAAGKIVGDVYWSDLDEPTLPGASIVPDTLSQEQAMDFEKFTPLVKEAYFMDSNWATGEEVQTFSFYPPQIVELIRQGKSIFR